MFIGGILLKLTSSVSLGKTIILSNYGGLCIDTYNYNILSYQGEILYYTKPKILAVIKFGSFSLNNVIYGFKSGSMVQYCHTYMHTDKKIGRF